LPTVGCGGVERAMDRAFSMSNSIMYFICKKFTHEWMHLLYKKISSAFCSMSCIVMGERVSDLGCEHMTFFQDTYTVNTSQ